ncbi:MAG TPA: RluA family pseudouridine synthase [Candidatus Magasanikbacteria bacterium]|nr:RluA family pseudouridine synthase [Candidatus Magasanikbacteria bacterium]
MLEVLYEDNHLIAVWKPAGMLVQGDETGDTCLMDEVKKYLKEKYQKPGNVFLGLLHRLDRPVAGIVLFAKTSKGAARLSEQIRAHQVKKIYYALVAGLSPAKGTLINYILKDEKTNQVAVFDEERGGALYAELYYEMVSSKNGQSLVRIELKTGRPHQIRAQFAHIGHPIVGDMKYGSKIFYRTGEIALGATELSFKTATTGENITVKKKIVW